MNYCCDPGRTTLKKEWMSWHKCNSWANTIGRSNRNARCKKSYRISDRWLRTFFFLMTNATKGLSRNAILKTTKMILSRNKMLNWNFILKCYSLALICIINVKIVCLLYHKTLNCSLPICVFLASVK